MIDVGALQLVTIAALAAHFDNLEDDLRHVDRIARDFPCDPYVLAEFRRLALEARLGRPRAGRTMPAWLASDVGIA